MGVLKARSNHNLRTPGHDQLAHVDQAKSAQNEILIGTGDAMLDVQSALKSRLVGNIRKNGVIAVEMVMTARADWFAADPARAAAFKQRVLDEANARYGANLVTAVWHMDEEAPHLHLYIVPMDQRGKLNCRAQFSTMASLKQLQDWAGVVGNPLGLERGRPKVEFIVDGDEPPENQSPAEYRAQTKRDAEAAAAARIAAERDAAEAARLLIEAQEQAAAIRAAQAEIMAERRQLNEDKASFAETLRSHTRAMGLAFRSWLANFVGRGQMQADGGPLLTFKAACPASKREELQSEPANAYARLVVAHMPDRDALAVLETKSAEAKEWIQSLEREVTIGDDPPAPKPS
nr:plasmid recombination protein [Paramagnetospirillum magneticum]